MFEEDVPFVNDETRKRIVVRASIDLSRGVGMMNRMHQVHKLKEMTDMASKSLYLRFPAPEGSEHTWEMQKFNMDMEPQERYYMTPTAYGEWSCTCPAHTTQCRHVKMLEIFDRAEAGEFETYNHIKAMRREPDSDIAPTVFLMFDGKMYNWLMGPYDQGA